MAAGGLVATQTLDGTSGQESGGGGEVEVIETPGTGIREPVVAVGGDLVSVVEEGGGLRLARSEDRGRTWDVVDLPDAPSFSFMEPIDLRSVGGLLVATAAVDPDPDDASYGSTDAYVWVSERGDEWAGGLVEEATPHLSFGHVGELDGGGLVTALTSSSGELVVLTSRDQGRSWARTSVAGVRAAPNEVLSPYETWRTETGSDRMLLQSTGVTTGPDRGDLLIESVDDGSTWRSVGSCHRPQPDPGQCAPRIRAGRLWLRGLETSLDGGTSWAPVRLELPPGGVASFDAAVELPGGGWVATVGGQVLGGGGALAWTLRSDDGVEWTPLLGPGLDGCQAGSVDTDVPQFAASPPVTAGDGRTYVSFSCPAPGGGGRSVLASFGRDDRSVDIVHEGDGDQRLLTPVRVGDQVLVPVVGLDDDFGVRRLVQVLAIRPG